MAKIGRPKEWTEERVLALAKELEDWFLEPGKEEERFYYQQFFSARRDLYPELISRLQRDNDAFRQSIKRIEKIQEERLVRLASKGKINPVFTIFTLKNKHGWADKQEIKSENINQNYHSDAQLASKSVDDLREALRSLTDTNKN